MNNCEYIKDFSRIYLETMGYIASTYITDNYNLFIVVYLGNGVHTHEINMYEFIKSDIFNLNECTKFLIKELEKIDTSIVGE